MKIVSILSSLGFACVLLYACSETQKKNPDTSAKATQDSLASCSQQPVMDPNNAKPMALMMRQIAANADSMKQQILRGEKLDSTRYPFIRFYLAEPTDPDVLEPQFYENARLFQEAYTTLFRRSYEQAKYHNLVIGKCITCHENYCSGPLKRIRKLLIPLN